jgi:hypothetical protein
MMNGVMQTKADDNRDEIARTLRIFGVIILVIGLLVPVWQTLSINNDAHFSVKADLLADVGWIAVGMAIEFFGVGLIILSDRIARAISTNKHPPYF